MSYVQHTKCIDLAKYKPLSYKAQPAVEILALFGGTLAWIAALIPFVMGMPLCGLHALGLMAYGGLFGYCNWWLYYRLVCLKGDRCAIGMLVSVETVEGKSWPGSYDTDFSLNLLLPNTSLGVVQADAEKTPPLGILIKGTPEIVGRSDLTFTGEKATPLNGTPKSQSAILHAEFEGAGVWIMFLTSAACLFLVLAAAMVCMVPVWGWIASIILELLALLALLFGHLGAQSDGANGNPADANPDLTVLHQAQGDGPSAADVLYVQGTWVFDGGHQDTHDGWNEIHPIKNAIIVGKWTGDWATAVDTEHKSLAEHCEAVTEALGTAQDPLTRSEQSKPENNWQWHPLIDGCEPDGVAPSPLH
jgi:hypothetical protein